jgi:hypothetical protein
MRPSAGFSIMLFLRDHTSHPTTWIFSVAGPPRDQMDVAMEHRLSSVGPRVDTDVKTGHTPVEPLNFGFHVFKKRKCCVLFRLKEAEKVSHMPFRDYESVQLSDRKLISNS